MKPAKLKLLIESGENINCEFKRKFSTHEKIAREMIAFANTKGGFILFGIDDNKSVVGVESEKTESELIMQTANEYCNPPVKLKLHFVEYKHKEIVIAEVPESSDKPHRIEDYKNDLDINSAVVTIRVNDKSLQASKEMIRLLRSESRGLKLTKYSLGLLEKSVFKFLEENEFITVKQLSSFSNISERRASRTLVKMVRANLLFIHTKENGEDYFSSVIR